MTDVGYVRVYRSLLGHTAFRNDGEAMAFAWMVIRAAWRPSRVRYKDRVIHLERGQLAISTRDMANAMDRDKAWVERLWKRLKAETMIETTVETGVTVVSVCNYDAFQADRDTRKTGDEATDETDARQGQDTEQGREKGKKGNTPPARPTGLPDEFVPVLTPVPTATVALWPPGMIERELAQFKDTAIRDGKIYSDWQAAFRTWIANAEKWRRERGKRSNYDKPSAWAAQPGFAGLEPASMDE